jgi:RNA polymerase sigma factor (TIGR02999 family)
MRRILVDHARERNAIKRGGWGERRPLDDALYIPAPDSFDLAALDRALLALAELDSQKAQVVELRYFGGLSVEDAAEVLSVSPTTVKRQWAFARAWLYRRLSGSDPV